MQGMLEQQQSQAAVEYERLVAKFELEHEQGIERQKADRPAEPIASLEGAIPEFEAPEIDRSQFQITVSDRDAQQC